MRAVQETMSTVYGAALRSQWGLDPDFLTVNHGSYGATPLVVRAEQDRWRQRMEIVAMTIQFLPKPITFRCCFPEQLHNRLVRLGKVSICTAFIAATFGVRFEVFVGQVTSNLPTA